MSRPEARGVSWMGNDCYHVDKQPGDVSCETMLEEARRLAAVAAGNTAVMTETELIAYMELVSIDAERGVVIGTK